MIIVDMGSALTCKNDFSYAKRMVDELAKVDTERDCIIKWQLFQHLPPAEPLSRELFHDIYHYASNEYEYQTTASVFDKSSLEFLLKYKIPFVKIANRPDLYKDLIGEIPRKVNIIASVPNYEYWGIRSHELWLCAKMCCVSKYPAETEMYEYIFGSTLSMGISDHTIHFELYRKYKPRKYEIHYKLEDSTGLDAGTFARTPEQIKELLCLYNESCIS